MHVNEGTRPWLPWLLLAFAIIAAAAVYWPGLSGGWLFDDYPNIVDNHGVQPHDASLPSLVGAALSSPSSEFKRPLSSLSFAADYLADGLNPFDWKLTNLVIHLLNGALVFLLARLLLTITGAASAMATSNRAREPAEIAPAGMVAALIAGGWMLLPINLTGVLYVVQRMESLANLLVLLGLLGYVSGRRHMLVAASDTRGFVLCAMSILACTGIGSLAKETAVMLPLYAFLTEWALFRFDRPGVTAIEFRESGSNTRRFDLRVIGLFVLVLALPMVLGLTWLLPHVLDPDQWSTRDFTLDTRLLSEARIVVDYIAWTLLPTPNALSFYHDDFRISTGLLTPWTTLASIIFLAALLALAWRLRKRLPLVTLGIALFLGCQLLTGTILQLELVYEHRNYFASFGVLLAIVPLLAVPRSHAFALPRHILLGGLLLCWAALTALTAYAWGNPLRLAVDLASRAPQSPRAQYELGRTYIIYSNYDPISPFTRLAYIPLEQAAALPQSSILPQQALIFMNSRMGLPLKAQWWDSLIAKLKARVPGVQDESSLVALTQCVREQHCNLPQDRMITAFTAALSHPHPDARLQATYGDYAWSVLGDHTLGLDMIEGAVNSAPNEPAYRITLVRMLLASHRHDAAMRQIQALQQLNIGGRLSSSISELQKQIDATTNNSNE